MKVVIVLILSYLIGSIPTAYLIIKKTKKIDIREIGSGNVGATNAIRAGGIWIGILTFVIDFLKGAIPVFFVKNFFDIPTLYFILPLTTIFVVGGHIFSVFLNFTGGKGVATAAGAMTIISPLIFLICIVFFIIVFLLTKIVSIGSITASIIFCSLIFLMPEFKNYPVFAKLLFLLLHIIIIYKHKSNIKKILTGNENKIL
jgi:glycerol-3-phosphate acyltransferase PlsY